MKARYTSAWYAKPGVIYFVGAGSPPVAIKIGVTQRDKLDQRLRAIQTSNHEPISLLGAITFSEGDLPLLQAERREQELHQQFAKCQRFPDGKVGHEWFSAVPELLAFIAALPAA